MKIGWRGLFCSILLYCFTESRGRFWPLNDRANEGDSLADIMRKVLETSPVRDALFILRDSSDGQANNILHKILAVTARRVPIFYINALQLEPEFQDSFDVLSRDLLVYIYVSQREPDIVEGELIADDLSYFVHTYGRPKILVLMILRKSSLDLTTFFQAIWSKKILSAIVVEYCRSNEHSTTIHRYDPFTDSLTMDPYSANTTEWFTDDFPNMQGYPLVYAYMRRPPYSDMVPTSTKEMWTLKGVDYMIIKTLADKMNFSEVFEVLMHNAFRMIYPNKTWYGMFFDLDSGKYEAVLNTLPIQPYDAQQFTETLDVEMWCFVVPSLPSRQSFFKFYGTGVRLLFTSFLIVGIFWLCARLMRLDLRRWHPLRIVGIMLTSSYPPAPARIHERIVFLSIFAACARYSSNFFGELTSLNLESTHYIQFHCLSDLIKSHLKLMIFAQYLDIITQDDAFLDSHMYDVDEKVEIINRIDDCLEILLMHQNVSCFMGQGWANLAAVNNMRGGQNMLTVTKLCYLWLPTGYLFSRGSPYIKRVSELLLMLRESGIRDKWQRDYLRNETRDMSEDKMNWRHSVNFTYIDMFRAMRNVLQFGYFLSILVFFGELIWKYLRLRLC